MGSNGFYQIYQQSLALTRDYFATIQSITENQAIYWDNIQEYALVASKIQNWRFQRYSQHPLKYWQACKNYSLALARLVAHLQEKQRDRTIPAWITPNSQDKRFRSNLWHDNLLFYTYQQSYLLYVQQVEAYLDDNVDPESKNDAQVRFYIRQWLNALSPTNYWLTNPDAMQKLLNQKGENIFHGWQNLLADLQKGQGYFNPTMVEANAYQVGKNIAATPGKVVFKNNLIELIQYTPTTHEVYATPLLIIPPWINKYYVLDLRQDNSFVKWIVDQGFSVFMISWKNPDKHDSDIAFIDYMLQGVLPASDAIAEITQNKQIHALGFCIGGTLLSMTLAYLAGKSDKRFKSATFLATLTDFANAGDLTLFIDEPQFALLKERMAQQGYLDGRLLMGIFNQLRANDLIWPYVINNYLLGQKPHAFDLLYWNQDSTHLPARMMCDYLENLYLNNRLVKEQLIWNEIPLCLQNIHIPCYFLATEQDHIAPWLACFAGAKSLGTDLTFVLGGSGHIAGIVNPPHANKYGYYTQQQSIKDFTSAAAWLQAAMKNEGSWWEHWQSWLAQKSGKKVKPIMPADNLPNAPGSNVKKTIYK